MGCVAGAPRRGVGCVEARSYQHRLQFIDGFRVGVVGIPGEGLPRRHLRPLGRVASVDTRNAFSLNLRLERGKYVFFIGCERLKTHELRLNFGCEE